MVVIFIVISLIVILKVIPSSAPDIPNNVPSPVLSRLATGTYIVKNLFGGSGQLKIENGLDLDAVAILSLKKPTISQTAVYIRANDSFTITGISDNVYVLYFTIGKNWDTISKRFLEKAEYQLFKDEFDFKTTLSKYTTWEVTLNPVPGGEAETYSLDENQFPSLHPYY